MKGAGSVIVVYAVYLTISIGLTAWLARILFRSGVEFLHDVFAERRKLADSVNHLLVVGFYMLNLGYALYLLRAGRGLDGLAAMQFLVNRLSILLVSLAILHFFNVFVFWRIRVYREQRDMPKPVAPQMSIPPTPPPPLPLD